MQNVKDKVLKGLKDDEVDAIHSYGKAIKSSKGKPKRVFKHIDREEKEHLRELKEIK